MNKTKGSIQLGMKENLKIHIYPCKSEFKNSLERKLPEHIKNVYKDS